MKTIHYILSITSGLLVYIIKGITELHFNLNYFDRHGCVLCGCIVKYISYKKKIHYINIMLPCTMKTPERHVQIKNTSFLNKSGLNRPAQTK